MPLLFDLGVMVNGYRDMTRTVAVPTNLKKDIYSLTLRLNKLPLTLSNLVTAHEVDRAAREVIEKVSGYGERLPTAVSVMVSVWMSTNFHLS